MLVPRTGGNFTSGGFNLLVLRHLHISASLYSFSCSRSVREDVAILVTLTLNSVRDEDKVE